ncbi:MAG: EAL domain-containing protein [Actinobacteria bacterium]|nr:EAL domain-containing protein [Actinomycetota bacterium]
MRGVHRRDAHSSTRPPAHRFATRTRDGCRRDVRGAPADRVNSYRSHRRTRNFGAVVRLSIDDFGTGFSSLAHLRDFRASELKLDGTFIRNVGHDASDDPIVRSIVQLAHSLGMTVVAEWVQSAEQLQRLRLLGCDHAQGNHVCSPTDETGLRDFVRRAAHSLGSGAGPTPA